MMDDRAQAMAGRLARAAATAEILPADATRIVRSFEFGYQHRIRVLDDPHHPQALHGARTALILLEDVGLTDADVLSLAPLFESRFAPLRVDRSSLEEVAGPRAAAMAASLPAGETGDQTLELLLAAPALASTLAVAERLDHARHLHLEPRTEWGPFHASFATHYLPASERLHPRLGRRCRWWADMFGRRYLGADPSRLT